MNILTHPADAELLADGDRATTPAGRQLRADNLVPTPPTARPTRVTIEQEKLDDGLPVMWRLFDDGHLRVAYDPRQTDYAGVKAVIASKYGAEALNLIPATEPTPAQAHAMAELSRMIWGSDDPAAAAREVLDLIHARKLDALLDEHGVTELPDAEGLDEPMFVRSDGRRYLLVPTNATPAETLEYVRDAFATEAGE